MAAREKVAEQPTSQQLRGGPDAVIDRQNTSLSNLRTRWIEDILPGLSTAQKSINPKYFYDHRGAKLFELITKTEEYYVCRAETEIFRTCADEIAEIVGRDCMLIEPGCGNCEKAELLLPALLPSLYVPMDISELQLQEATRRLQTHYSWLHCLPVTGEFEDLVKLPVTLSSGRRVVFFPGSTIGNFEPKAAVAFMRDLHALIGLEGGLLIGVDRGKDRAALERAYNDAAGVTALFNLNILNHVNQLTGSDFRIGNFRHVALYNEIERRIEMYLRSTCDQTVSMGDAIIGIGQDELLHTEYSYKYSTRAFSQLATAAGFVRARTWHDKARLFSLHYFVAA